MHDVCTGKSKKIQKQPTGQLNRKRFNASGGPMFREGKLNGRFFSLRTSNRDARMSADSKRPRIIARLHSCCQRPCLALEFGDQDKQVQNADPARQR